MICNFPVLEDFALDFYMSCTYLRLLSTSIIRRMYRGTQLDSLSTGDTIRLNSYIPRLAVLYGAYHCSLSTFHHRRSIDLAAANAETIEIGFYPILYLKVYQSLRAVIRLIRRPLQICRTSRYAVSSTLGQGPPW